MRTDPRDRLLGRDDSVDLLRRRCSIIAEQLGFDPRRVAGWAFVLAVVASRWALEDEGVTEADGWLPCASMLREVHEAVPCPNAERLPV